MERERERPTRFCDRSIEKERLMKETSCRSENGSGAVAVNVMKARFPCALSKETDREAECERMDFFCHFKMPQRSSSSSSKRRTVAADSQTATHSKAKKERMGEKGTQN